MKKSLLAFYFTLIIGNSFAQEIISPLLKKLAEAKPDTAKVLLYNRFIRYYQVNNQQKDTLFSVEKNQQIADLQSHEDLLNATNQIHTLEEDKYRIAYQRNGVTVLASAFLVVILGMILYYKKQHKLNILLKNQQIELNKLHLVKDKIFSIIGHDLRGPMATMSSTLYLIDKDLITPEEKQILFKRLKALNRNSIGILNKLLYWGTLQINGIFLNRILFNPTSYITTSLDLFDEIAEIKLIKIINTIKQDLEIYADPNHFDFIFRNVIQNAIKYTVEKGTIMIKLATNQPENYVTFAIDDNGIGMDKRTVDALFGNQFTTTRGTNLESGTGLGLMLCKEFIEENGGKIWAESVLGDGSVFFLSFAISKES